MPLLGQLALWLALLLALWGVATGYAGARLDRPDLQESARRATVAFTGAMFTAVAALAVGAWWQDFHLAFIAAHADRTLRTRDAWVVLLDGAGGQWLVTGCALAAGLAAARHSGAGLDRRALSLAISAGSAALAGVVMVLLLAARPFDLLAYTPLDGQGLSPRLYDLDARLAVLAGCLAYAATGVAAACFVGVRTFPNLPNALFAGWARVWGLIAWVLLSAELALSLGIGMREGGSVSVALRPTLPLWVLLTAALHLRRSLVGVAAHITHTGATLIVIGLVAAAFGTRVQVRLRPGESAHVAGYAITYRASSVYPAHNQVITQGLLELRRGARQLGRVGAVRRQQTDVFGRERSAPSLRAGTWHGLTASVHVRWVADSAAGGGADFGVAVLPLAPWLWLGCWLLGIGGLAALWPGRERP